MSKYLQILLECYGFIVSALFMQSNKWKMSFELMNRTTQNVTMWGAETCNMSIQETQRMIGHQRE